MRLHLLALALVTLCVGVSAKGEFPAAFLGTWTVGKSENLDEYLTEKGYSWFTRQLVKAASITKTFKKAAEPGRYDISIDTTTADVEWKNVPFDEEFEGEYIDGAVHKIRFFEKDGHLFEDHKPGDKGGEAKPDLYEYVVDGPNAIIMIMRAGNIVCKRWYNRD